MNATYRGDVMKLFQACSEAYLQHGQRLQFPANTDPTKTYQWRYLTRMADKIKEWGLDDATTQRYLCIAVGYAKERGLAAKGLSVLLQENMLELCRERLDRELKRSSNAVEELRAIKLWVDGATASKDPVAVMLSKQSRLAYCSLVQWYQRSQVTDLYIALSRNCGTALTKMSEQDRATLPDRQKLYLSRLRFMQDEGRVTAASGILKEDLRCR